MLIAPSALGGVWTPCLLCRLLLPGCSVLPMQERQLPGWASTRHRMAQRCDMDTNALPRHSVNMDMDTNALPRHSVNVDIDASPKLGQGNMENSLMLDAKWLPYIPIVVLRSASHFATA
eukprot:5742114-Amphidinium_carterae.2